MANTSVEFKSQPHALVCRRCGKAYGVTRGHFPASNANLYKGAGYIPYCYNCITEIYESFLRESGDQKRALQALCLKLNLYWNDRVYRDLIMSNFTGGVEQAYLKKINNGKYVNYSFEDTLREKGAMWNNGLWRLLDGQEDDIEEVDENGEKIYNIPKAVKKRFGPGYSDKIYDALQTRYEFWLKQLPDGVDRDDAGTQALLIQLCGAELDAANQRTAGQSADRSVKTINDVIASLGLRPASKKDDELNAALERVPLGVWLKRYEEERPLPELDEPLKDNKIKRYIMTWCVGHLAKMLGLKNEYTKMYDKAIEQLHVERPSFEGDDEDLIIEAFGEEDYSSIDEEEESTDDKV